MLALERQVIEKQEEIEKLRARVASLENETFKYADELLSAEKVLIKAGVYIRDSYRPEPKYDAMRFDELKDELDRHSRDWDKPFGVFDSDEPPWELDQKQAELDALRAENERMRESIKTAPIMQGDRPMEVWREKLLEGKSDAQSE